MKNEQCDWVVDLAASTATHKSGWVFKFSRVKGQLGVFDGECVKHPENMTSDDMKSLARTAREAGEVYIEALKARH